MAVTVLPDAVALVISYLESQSPITSLVSGRVYGKMPASPTFPLILVRRTGGTAGWPHYIDRPSLQLDVYGRNETEASQVARVALAVLKSIPMEHSRGVVTDCREILGLQDLPDPTYSPAKPKWVFGVALTIHP